jgi:hypothetical protein
VIRDKTLRKTEWRLFGDKMKLTVEELRTIQLALLNMESGSGIAKMQSLSNKLEVEVQRLLTKRALDLPSASCPKCHNFGGTHFSLCPLANTASR